MNFHRTVQRITLLFTVCLLVACGAEDGGVVEDKAPAILRVQTATLLPQTWRASFDSYGYLESTERVAVSMDFSGTVKQVHVRDGEKIRAGQELIELDSRKQVFRLDRAEATVESAEAEMEKAQSTYQRHRDLATTGALSKEQLKQSEASYERASAALQESQAALSLARQELRETIIISPVDGTIVKRNVELGQTVLPGDQLLDVEVTDTLRMVTYVSQKEVNLLRVGDTAPVVSPAVPGRQYEARVELVGSSADPNTGNFVVKLTINNQDHLLRAGMSARAQLQGVKRDNILLVSKAVIVDRNRRRVVYRLNQGQAEEVEPVFGVSGTDDIPVYAGLAAGDEIIVSHLELLLDGKAVESLPAIPAVDESLDAPAAATATDTSTDDGASAQ